MILADYSNDFHALSSRHEALIKRAADVLDAYQRGDAQHPTYAVIGTFGAGKTQFLYHLARQALGRAYIPGTPYNGLKIRAFPLRFSVGPSRRHIFVCRV